MIPLRYAQVTRQVAAPVEVVWAAVTDWPAQGRWVPLTTVRTTSARADGVGAAFTARTGIGPLGFDDPMTVSQWSPPSDAGGTGSYFVEKHGRVVLGYAEVTVTALGPGRTRLTWTEGAQLAGVRYVPGLRDLLDVATVLGLAFVVRRLARDVEAAHRRRRATTGPT